jgi:hypothetical protein
MKFNFLSQSIAYFVNFSECTVAKFSDYFPIIFRILVCFDAGAKLFPFSISGHTGCFEYLAQLVEQRRHCSMITEVDGVSVLMFKVNAHNVATSIGGVNYVDS